MSYFFEKNHCSLESANIKHHFSTSLQANAMYSVLPTRCCEILSRVAEKLPGIFLLPVFAIGKKIGEFLSGYGPFFAGCEHFDR